MIKTIRKFLILGIALIMCLGLFVGCSSSAELKQGVYVYETTDERASVTLHGNNEFEFDRGLIFSWLPTGSYSIQKGKLFLHLSDDEGYIFSIKKNRLVFLGSTSEGSFVDYPIKPGTVFEWSYNAD